ncbi:MAG: ABC transporter permease subunit [Verrucomicrobiales bacterium]|nr:ABC transporter permease subunit [Verrucomicrobiales bacterium]
MRAFWIIFCKELRSFFLSPLAYVLMALFTGIAGFLFARTVESMQQKIMPRSLIFNLVGSGFFWMGFLILFPLITMRLFAEERKMGTLEGLFTAPVRTSEVVLGKFFATVVLYCVLILPMFLFFPIFKLVTGQSEAFHNGAFWGAFIGLMLVGTFNISIGVFASSVTQNQLIAAMLTFVGVMMHYMLGFLLYINALPESQWTAGLNYFSTIEHISTLSEGLIDTRPFVYYLSFSAVLLALTHHVLEYRKWKA